jgi:hypothetical protein
MLIDDVEQRRLASAIWPDDADSIARANHDRSAGEEHSVTDSPFELRESQ